MIFSNAVIENIKDRVSISSVISRKVKLENRAGKLLGLCPFHKEKTPSFTVNDNKGFYYCFGCQENGDVFNFIMKTENLGFHEAIEYVASFAGIDLPKEPVKNQQQEAAYNRIYAILEEANNFFKNQIKLSNSIIAKNYILSRKIDNNAIDEFQIGFAPDSRNALIKHLEAKKYTHIEIKNAGLLVKKEIGEIDKFRNRLIFPICNPKGQVIAFGGRTLDNSIPKYLNSPETMLFKKNEVLYAENIAKIHAYKENRLVVVEGYMDAISMHQHGIKETVATMGTAITQNHLARLWKIVDEPIMCLDGDEAGIRAMTRAAEIAFPLLSEGKSLNFITLPDGKDPDDVINERGRDGFLEILSKPKPLSEVIWENEKNKLTNNTPEQISMLEKKFGDMVLAIDNHRVKKNYQNFFNNKLWEFTKSLSFKGFKKKNKIAQIVPKNIDILDIITRYEYIMVAEIMNEPRLLLNDAIKDDFINIDFTEEFLDVTRSALLDFVLENSNNEEFLKLENVASVMKKHNIEREYAMLCGEESSFLDRISKSEVSEKVIKWQLLFKRYNLSLLEREYNKNILKPNNEAIIDSLKGEMNVVKESIRIQDSLFDN